MGTSLNGLTPAGTYPGLIKTGDNAPIDGTLKTLSDGNGNNLPMSVSTTTINLTGTAQVGGVAIANTTQLAAKQDTLVSGTNIKTINGTSVLGSGDIVTPYTPPSGVSGAIQFSNGSAFASDAANLFWDDTNNRLGIGTNAPTRQVEIVGSVATPAYLALRYGTATGSGPVLGLDAGGAGLNYQIISTTSSNGSVGANALGIFDGTDYRVVLKSGNLGIGEVAPTARTQIKGSGSTSATTSLLVQNSAGSAAIQVLDDLKFRLYSDLQFGNGNQVISQQSGNLRLQAVGFVTSDIRLNPFRQVNINNGDLYTAQTSAILQVDATDKGFLQPRMTTTQKNAIASPAAGLQVYDTTLNQMSYYNGSSWVNF